MRLSSARRRIRGHAHGGRLRNSCDGRPFSGARDRFNLLNQLLFSQFVLMSLPVALSLYGCSLILTDLLQLLLELQGVRGKQSPLRAAGGKVGWSAINLAWERNCSNPGLPGTRPCRYSAKYELRSAELTGLADSASRLGGANARAADGGSRPRNSSPGGGSTPRPEASRSEPG